MNEMDRTELAEIAEGEVIVPVVVEPALHNHRPQNPLRALKQRDFGIAWTGIALSNIGSWAQNAVIPFVIYALTKNAAVVGFVTFLAFAPAVVLGPIGGVLAERGQRRWVVLGGSVVSAGATITLFLLWTAGVRSVAVIAACVMFSSSVNWLIMPAWTALVYDLSDPNDLQTAVTLNSGQYNLARAVGPAMAGLLYAQYGAGSVFFVNACSFAFAIVAMLLVRVPRRQVHPGASTTLRDAARYMRSQSALMLPTALVAIAVLMSFPLLQLVPVLAQNVLDVGAEQYGFITAMFGVGGVVGAIVLAAITNSLRRSHQVVIAFAVIAVTIGVLAFAGSYPVALIAMFGTGVGYITLASGTITTVQANVDDAYRGRVIAFYLMVVTTSVPLYSLINGWLTQRVGLTPVLVGMAAISMLTALVVLANGRWRAIIDRAPAPQATSGT